MNVIQRIRNWFKKGGYALSGQELNSINDHPKINIDPNELARIQNNLRQYQNKYPKVRYRNSYGQLQERDYMVINMRKITARFFAGLCFNEQCDIYISDVKKDENKRNTYQKAHDFIQEVFEQTKFKRNLAKHLEPMFALGGIAARPYVDLEEKQIKFSWAIADAFFPLKSDSAGISEGVFVNVTTKVEKGEIVYYTLLEFHEWEKNAKGNKVYVITNELYKSEKQGEIGRRVPLSELYEELEERAEIPGLEKPLFSYLKPAGFNNINPHSPLGLGVCDNSESTLKKINDTYDQFWWEIKMGQRTVIVSDAMLQILPDEAGNPPAQVFDPDVNVYKAIRMHGDQEPVKDVTHDIRTQQYIEAINNSLRTLEMELQLSIGTFTFDGRSVKTATEIVSENSLTFRTRNEHVHEIEQFIRDLIISTLELAQIYGLYKGPIPVEEHIGVDFDDGVFQDRAALLRFYGQAKSFGFIPTTEAIQRIFKVPEETAEEWAKEIMNEQIEMDPSFLNDQRYREIYGDEE